jgi:N-acyl-D-amino-acid deacylase
MIRVTSLVLFVVSAVFAQNGAPYDILIAGGQIVDGSGNPWFRGDVATRGDSIAAVGLLSGATAKVTLDASGLVVAPGFIDIHSHGRRGIFETPTAANYLHEGVTTLVEGPDGSSPLPLVPFLDRISKTPISINFASMAGQGTIREQVVGLANRKATPEEIEKMKALAAQAMRGWRVRPVDGPLLRAGQLLVYRGSDRARQGCRANGRHPHLAHARRSIARDR